MGKFTAMMIRKARTKTQRPARTYNKRKGLGLGLGKGFKNLIPKDPFVHSMSARGVKTLTTPFYDITQARYVPVRLNAKGEFDYSGDIVPDKDGKVTPQEEHVRLLRHLAYNNDLKNYDLFVEFMDKRFPKTRDETYIKEWIGRFKSGDPVPYMDGQSRKVYHEALKRKYSLSAKGKLTKKQLMKQRAELVKELRNMENQKEEVELGEYEEREEYENDVDYYEYAIEEIEERLEKNSEQLRKVKK